MDLYEQIEFDSYLFDAPASPTFNTLDDNGFIYSKVDWLTTIFFDCSLNSVLAWLHLDDCVSEFCSSVFQQSRGYDDVFKFIYNGVLLETSSFNFYGSQIDVSLFDIIVPKIRLDLSGSALDFLRSIGVNMDSYRFTSPVLPDGGSYHFTRCDFAYDFINYKPEFIDSLLTFINGNILPSGRIPLASTKGAISCRVVTGNQKTIYLGSPQSDRMLRIYDKRLQFVDLDTQVYVKDNPYNNPDSWFRIEWQTRNKFANNLVQDSNLDFIHILRLIFDSYSFADGAMDARNKARSPVDFWLTLFSWADIEHRVVQNANFVQYEEPDDRVIRSFETTMLRTFMFYYSLVGKDGLESICNKYLDSLRLLNPVSHRRSLAFYNRLNMLSCSRRLTASSPGLFIDSDILKFKL